MRVSELDPGIYEEEGELFTVARHKDQNYLMIWYETIDQILPWEDGDLILKDAYPTNFSWGLEDDNDIITIKEEMVSFKPFKLEE